MTVDDHDETGPGLLDEMTRLAEEGLDSLREEVETLRAKLEEHLVHCPAEQAQR